MAKQFNYTGTCIPEKHYMVDTSGKIEKIMVLIEAGQYFAINKPRQYGKTTTLFLLQKRLLAKGILPISLSFEGIGDLIFEDEKTFSKGFVKKLSDSFLFTDKKLSKYFLKKAVKVNSIDTLSQVITQIIKEINKPVILMIDEVDKSSNNQLFISFLGMLRNKYLNRNEGKDFTFQSVILAGVHDIKSLKLKLRPDSEEKYNSPWNIAADLNVDLAFSAQEIATMLIDYTQDKKVQMDIEQISEKIFHFTSGYPFLVSKLCYIIDDRIMKADQWQAKDVDDAAKQLLYEDNTNFQSLVKNIENDKDLYELVKQITLDGAEINLVKTDPVISMAITHGIIKDKMPGICQIHNRIYAQLLYDHIVSGFYRKQPLSRNSISNIKSNFILPDASLDFEKILVKFQQFMKEQYSEKDTPFLERNGRLIFLAFIKPIINGQGYDFKEAQISEEKRLDVVITYNVFRYVVELKIWHGEALHEKGIKQLSDYLETQQLSKGFLVIFDFRKEKTGKQEKIEMYGKEIFEVWV